MAETRIHPETGRTLRRGLRPQTVTCGSMTREVVTPGWYPDDDGDAIHTGKDLDEADHLYRRLQAAHAVA